MNRESMMDLLIRYADDDVTSEERTEVEAALTSSEEWRRELDMLQHVQGVVARRREVSPGLWEGVAAQIEMEAEDPGAVAGIWGQFEWAGKRLAPLFAAAAVILLTLMSTNGSESSAATYEDYLLAQWEGEGVASWLASEDELTADDMLYFSLEE